MGKRKNFNKIFIIKNFYFLGKKIILLLLCNKFILNELLKSSSRDNSIMFIEDLIAIRSSINIMLLSLEELFNNSFRINLLHNNNKIIFFPKKIKILLKFYSFIGSSRLKNNFKNFHLNVNFI